MSETVYLRSLELSDLERIHTWHNDPELYATLTNPFRPVSLQTVEDWLKKRIEYSSKEVNFAICLSATSEHIGNIYLRDIDYVSRNGLLGAFIGKSEHRGKGYATEALQQTVNYAFETLGLHKLYMYVLATNQAAIKHLKKCHFTVEGQLRDHLYRNSAFHDLLIMGLCREGRD